MTQQEILNSDKTKTEKMRLLFELGLTRREVSNLMEVGYGFAQNVYAKYYGTARTNQRTITNFVTERTEFNFSFNRNFGIEIEAFNIDRNELSRKLNEAGINTTTESYNHETRNYWKVITDGSLRGTNTFELVSPILNGTEGLEQLQKVCRVLKSLNGKINKTCGLHIHFEASNFDLNQWKNLTWNYATLENEIDSWMPLSRRGSNNTYCGTIRTTNWQSKIQNASNLRDLSRAITNDNRYKKLNFQSFWRHQTAEFRQHSGTIEFDKISNWVLFLARLIEFSKETRIQNSSNVEFMNEELKAYYNTRKTRMAS